MVNLDRTILSPHVQTRGSSSPLFSAAEPGEVNKPYEVADGVDEVTNAIRKPSLKRL